MAFGKYETFLKGLDFICSFWLHYTLHVVAA